MSRIAQRAAKIEAQLAELSAVTVVETRAWGGHPAMLIGVYGEEAHAAKAIARWHREHPTSPVKDEHAALLKRYRLTLPKLTQGTATGGPTLAQDRIEVENKGAAGTRPTTGAGQPRYGVQP